MKQILHIFAKDARHQWIEILISLALTAALVIVAPRHWTSMRDAVSASFSPLASMTLLADSVTFFVLLSWWILISPLVHEESLVGDRQFWLTRPYHWQLLLAAKTLFVFVFVLLPLFVAQCTILAMAGFNALSYLPGILYNLLLITGIAILPFFALATITRNFARMTLVILGVLLCLIAISWLASKFPGARIATPVGDSLSLVLAVSACAAVITLQYAMRRSVLGWLFLSGILAAIAVLACAAPDQALLSRRYSGVSEQPAAIQLSYRDDANGPVVSVARSANEVMISVPIRVSGVAHDTVMIPQDLKVSLEAADGPHWTSFWQPISRDKFLPGERDASASFVMPRSLYERLKLQPLGFHLVMAMERAQVTVTDTISMPLDQFRIPGFATCTPVTGFADKPYEIGEITCRTALRLPPLTLVQMVRSHDDCHLPVEQRRDVQAQAWVGTLGRSAANLAIDPVWTVPVSFINDLSDVRGNEPRHICSGSTATFTVYQSSGRLLAPMDVQGFKMPQLSQGQLRFMDNAD